MLTILTLYRKTENNVFILLYRDGDRVVEIGDGEHMCCTIYQMLANVMPHRRTNVTQPAQPHGNPSKMETARNYNCFPQGTVDAADTTLVMYAKMMKDGTWAPVSEQFRLPNEEKVQAALNSIAPPHCSASASLPDDTTVSEDPYSSCEDNQRDEEDYSSASRGGGSFSAMPVKAKLSTAHSHDATDDSDDASTDNSDDASSESASESQYSASSYASVQAPAPLKRKRHC